MWVFGQDDEAVGHGFFAGEDGFVVAVCLGHQRAGRLAGGGIGNETAVGGGYFGIEGVVDVFEGVGGVVRIFGNHQGVDPHRQAVFGHEHLDIDAVAGFDGPVAGDVQIAAVAHGHAQVASGEVVDVCGGGEDADVFAYGTHHVGGRLQVFGLGAVGVFA